MKVFISQPMRDKTNEQIEAERERALANLQKHYPKADIEVLDSFFKNAPHHAAPLWFLGKSFEILSRADVAYFVSGWKNYRGCKLEKLACDEYGIETITEQEEEQ
jgi:hypothetical protein